MVMNVSHWDSPILQQWAVREYRTISGICERVGSVPQVFTRGNMVVDFVECIRPLGQC